MDPINIYSSKASDYAAYRPEYAVEAFSVLRKLTNLYSNWIVADIGSGTGKATKHLVDHVKRIFAVEPDEAMRHQAELLLGNYPAFTSLPGKAEATNLPDHSIDLILVGQAIHWFNTESTCIEFRRILKPEGWLAIVWNRFGEEKDPDVSRFFEPNKYRHLNFPADVTENWEQYFGGSRSTASAPCEGQSGYREYQKAKREIFESRAIDGSLTAFAQRVYFSYSRRSE
jgi:ubiquinone/menaquinone biosynthesis C-methylase UbiE